MNRIRNFIKPQLIRNILQDAFFEHASSPLGFLQVISWLRFGILLVLITHFGLFFTESPLNSSLRQAVSLILIAYSIFILFLLILLHFNKRFFVSRSILIIQIVVDSIVILVLYLLPKIPDSSIFLLLFLPVLVLARFFNLKSIILFMFCVTTLMVSVWLVTFNEKQLQSFSFWFQTLLPQIGFLLIMAFFYLIYYRRRGIEDHLQKSAQSLVDTLDQLWSGNFMVDSSFKITWADDKIRSRHKYSDSSRACMEVFCKRGIAAAATCGPCPIAAVLRDEISGEESTATFVDRAGTTYSAGLRASPQYDEHGNIVAASVYVRDLDQLRAYERRLQSYVENFERVADERRSEEAEQLNAMIQQVKGITNALQSLPGSDLEQAIKEVLLTATRQLNAQVVILAKPALDVKSSLVGLQISFYSGLPPSDAQSMTFLPLESNSLAVKAFKSGQWQSVEDLTNSSHPHYLLELRRNNLHSQACFPLTAGGQTIGVISMFRKWIRGFTQEEMNLGQAFANLIALMMASNDAISLTSHQAKERQHLLGTLESLGLSLSPGGRPQDLAQQLADFICQTMHAETCAIFLRDGDLLHRVAISQLETEWFSEECYQVGQGLTGLAVLPLEGKPYGQPVIENDVPHSEIVIQENLERYRNKLATGKVCHLVAVPIVGQAGPLGVIRVVNKLTDEKLIAIDGFTQQDVETITAAVSSVGILLENSLQQLKQRILTELAQSFTSSLSYWDVLKKSLEQAVQLLHAELGFILLHKEGSDELTFEVTTGVGSFRLQQQILPQGQGIAYEVFRGDEPQLVVSADNDDRFEGWLYRRTGLQVQSLLSVPIHSPSGVIGVLELASQQPGAFNLADATLLGDLTPWIGIAISNALQYQSQEMRADFLSRLQANLQQIDTDPDKKLTMNKVAQAAGELMNCEFAGVALYNKERQEIYAVPGAGYVGVSDEYVRKFHFSVDRPGGQVLRQGKVYMSEDASGDFTSIFGRRLIEPLDARGVIAAPLLVGNRIVGILYAATRVARRWTEDQARFFSILAKHSAIAIRNAELWDRRERRAQLLNLIHEISIAGQLTNDINLILNIILTAITAEYGLRFNRALLFLYDKRQGVLKGFTGIGQMERDEAQLIWETLDHSIHNMNSYVHEVLEKKSVPSYTALHYKAGNLVIPVDSESNEVLSKVVRTRRSEMVDAQKTDVKINSDFFHLMQPGFFVATPLVANDEVVGLLVVDNKFSRTPIGEIERDLLSSCASQAAAAIQRSQLHQRLEQQVNALDQLQQVVRTFSELASPQESLKRIAQAAKNLLHADISQLIPYDAGEGKLLVEQGVGAGYSVRFVHDPDISEHGLTRRVLDQTSDMLVLEEVEKVPDLNSYFVREFDIKSVAGCRLEFAGEIVGLLYVNYCVLHRFDTAELEVLYTLASHAAVAIHNSRLMETNRVLAAQAERSRLREDLHDILGKLQFKITAEAESIYEKLKNKRDRGLATQAEEIWRYARHIYEQLERILKDMADSTLPESGLPEALRNLLKEVSFPLDTFSVQGESRASPEVELMFYRICQEAVVNIIKHARLPKNKQGFVEIRLEQAAEYTKLVVQDHGQGFSPSLLQDKDATIGLTSMRARARKINAQLQIHPRPGEGVYIEVVAPQRVKENL